MGFLKGSLETWHLGITEGMKRLYIINFYVCVWGKFHTMVELDLHCSEWIQSLGVNIVPLVTSWSKTTCNKPYQRGEWANLPLGNCTKATDCEVSIFYLCEVSEVGLTLPHSVGIAMPKDKTSLFLGGDKAHSLSKLPYRPPNFLFSGYREWGGGSLPWG